MRTGSLTIAHAVTTRGGAASIRISRYVSPAVRSEQGRDRAASRRILACRSLATLTPTSAADASPALPTRPSPGTGANPSERERHECRRRAQTRGDRAAEGVADRGREADRQTQNAHPQVEPPAAAGDIRGDQRRHDPERRATKFRQTPAPG